MGRGGPWSQRLDTHGVVVETRQGAKDSTCAIFHLRRRRHCVRRLRTRTRRAGGGAESGVPVVIIVKEQASKRIDITS
jgi:hypothetical protein